MSLQQTIKKDRILALKNGDKSKSTNISLILAAITQVEVDTRKELTDADVIQILTKMVKQRQESIAQFTQAGRSELIAKELEEKALIESYLPAQLSEDEVRVRVSTAIAETGATSIKEMGAVIAKLKPELVGKFDMGKVSQMVKEQLGV